MKIILASASPRRKELMEQLGLEFEIRVSDVEEIVTGTNPTEVVKELSALKARAVFQNTTEEVLVIGADTVVALDGEILGKPADRQDAENMLRRLQGREHSVYTGVTLCVRKNGEEKKISFSEGTGVRFYPMTEEEIKWYVETSEPEDKAGAYGIQGIGGRFVERIKGDYNNVVGLPIARLYHETKNIIKFQQES